MRMTPTPTSDAGSPAQGPPWQLIVASFIAVTALAGLPVLRRILSKPA